MCAGGGEVSASSRGQVIIVFSLIRFVLKVEDITFRLEAMREAGLSLQSPSLPTLGPGQDADASPSSGSNDKADSAFTTVTLPLIESHGDQVRGRKGCQVWGV